MSVRPSSNSATLFCPWKSWSYSDPLSMLPESTFPQISSVDTLHPSTPSISRMSPQLSRPSTSRTLRISTYVVRTNQPQWIRSLACSETPLGYGKFSFFAVPRPRASFPFKKSPSTSWRFSRCGFTTQSRYSASCACPASDKSA